MISRKSAKNPDEERRPDVSMPIGFSSERRRSQNLSQDAEKIGVDGYRWEILFQCKVCKTYWLETHSDSARSDGPVFLTKTIDQEVILRFDKPEHDFSMEL